MTLKKEIEEWKKKYGVKDQENEDHKNQIKQLQGEKSDLQKQIAELNAKIAKLNSEIEDLKRELKLAQERLESS